ILMNINRLISTLAVAAFLYVGSLAFAQNGGQGTYQDQGDRGSVTVPAGTEISVRTNEAIDSQNASEGQQYSATVLQDIHGGAGEGAAIGAVAGAGAGGTAQVLTKGKTVKVPAETILRFQLDRPLHLSGY